jgi:hypothetical protein
VPAGSELVIKGRAADLRLHLPAWCREQGHSCDLLDTASPGEVIARVTGGAMERMRWSGAERAGGQAPGDTLDRARPSWGLAARGALVEAGGADAGFDLDEKREVWTDLAPRLYAQAAAAQWDPATVVDWSAPGPPSDEVEDAVVQVMTYLIENEQAALAVPARFAGRVHPHYREVAQFLAIQVADEARHVEVFSRRAVLHARLPGTSTVGGRASLTTLLDEPDFGKASFLLSVLGEGTFLNLLSFLEQHGPDAVTRAITGLARQDETRHVAFAMGHIEFKISQQPELLDQLRAAIERRYEVLHETTGLNEEVYESLVILAAGSWSPKEVARGFRAVAELEHEMADGRERRLMRLGFPASEASLLAALHTRNFM